MFSEERQISEEVTHAQSYSDLISINEKDLRIALTRIMDVCDFIYQKYNASKDNEHSYDEHDMRLTRKEENGKIN